MNIMEQIRNHPLFSTCFHKYQIDSLGEKVDFLLDFMENYNSHGGSKEAEDLESQIASAAHEAEDVMESHVVGQIHAGSSEKSLRCLFDLQKVLLDIGSIKEKVMKVKEERGSKDQQPKYSEPAVSSRAYTTGKTTMVGFDNYLDQLLDGVIGLQSDRQIIPIVGMGGIGKTTLARNVYENLLAMEHFDLRAWVTVSQEYNVREILLETLSSLRKSASEIMDIEDQLGEQLYKFLSGRRYLIILDDMWSIEVWDWIKFFFPDNYNRSRIIVTTRVSEVANHLGPKLALDLLDDNNSWKLFCEKASVQEDRPFELEEVGKEIVKKCKGLPLSIAVIGGLLGKSPRTQEYWEMVAKDVSSILNSTEDNQCLNILSLSYSHLPVCLKPCFLYLGIFPEDRRIHASRLIKLWVAEGFIKPNKYQSLEEVAEGYIKDLFDRNLILVRGLRPRGKLEAFHIHDLLRELCLRIAEKEKFLCVRRALDVPRDIARERRIVYSEEYFNDIEQECIKEQPHDYHDNIKKDYQLRVSHNLKSASLARSITCERHSGLSSSEPRLLRVLVQDSEDHNNFDCPNLSFQQVNMRFFDLKSVRYFHLLPYKLPSSISLLWNLQTLIIEESFVAPPEIWNMPQLRHLEAFSITLPDPPPSGEQDDFVLQSLQTLKRVMQFKCSEEVWKRIPNIKELGIDIWEKMETTSCYCLYNVGRFNKLESLNCCFDLRNADDFLQKLTFPRSLKELTLGDSRLHWNELTLIGSLPHLEVLELVENFASGNDQWNPIEGEWNPIEGEWNPIEGEFLHLKFLKLSSCDGLTNWNADSSHFPVLENLTLAWMRNLCEIPLDIGEIPTLQDICVAGCSPHIAISAMKILEEQENQGYQSLHVQVKLWEKKELKEFRRQVEVEGITCHNYQVECYCR